MEFPCSQILQLSQIYNPSTGWRSSSKWPRLCCRPLTMSRSLWAWWNTPGSTQLHRLRNSRSPCTSPQSGNSCLPCSWASRQIQAMARQLLDTNYGAPVCLLLLENQTEARTRGWTWFCVHNHMFCLELGCQCFVMVTLVFAVAIRHMSLPAWVQFYVPVCS